MLDQHVAISSNTTDHREQARNKPRDCKTRTGPPKRSPGAVGTAAGANRKNSKPGPGSRKTSTKRHRSTQEPDRSLSVYDGTVRLASITGRAGKFIVVTAAGNLLGNFETLRQASAAISALVQARELGLVDDTRDNINSHDGGER